MPKTKWQENRALKMACCLECLYAKHCLGKRFRGRYPDFAILDSGFGIADIKIRNPKSQIPNRLTVTRSCGILTRLPCR